MNLQILIVLVFVLSLLKNFVKSYDVCDNFMMPAEELVREMQTDFPFMPWPKWISKKAFKYAGCDRKGFENVPRKAISKNIEILNLSDNHLRRISADDFPNLPNLIALYFDRNCLRYLYEFRRSLCTSNLYIKPGSFHKFKKLKYLSLLGNYLREFPLDLPNSLAYMDLGSTFLGNITLNLQRNLVALEGISFRGNCYNIVNMCPRNFTITSNLSFSPAILDLEMNYWFKVPKFLLYPKLRVFIFSFNPVKRLCKNDFVNSKKLQVLMLQGLAAESNPMSNNPLQIDEGVFDSLQELTILDLSTNGLTRIASNLFQNNKKLKKLDLSKNSLYKTIYNPTYITHLHMLEYLDISVNNNKLEDDVVHEVLHLEESYSNLTLLETFLIGFHPAIHKALLVYSIERSTKFKTLSNRTIEMLSKWKRLSFLSIGGMSLQYLDPVDWSKMSNLKFLYASHNKINFQTPRSSKVFFYSSKESHLSLKNRSSTYGRFVSKNKFTKAKSVYFNSKVADDYECDTELSLSHNAITRLGNHLDFLLQDACKLDLSHNSIFYIYNNDFKNFTKLTILILDYNPLSFIYPYALTSLKHLQIMQMVGVSLEHSNVKILTFLSHLPFSVRLNLVWKDAKDTIFLLFNYWNPEKHGWIDFVNELNLTGNSLMFSGELYIFTRSFRYLKKLVMRNCAIDNLMVSHPIVSKNNSLMQLDLGSNNFENLPVNLSVNLHNLSTLTLDYNFISNLSGPFLCNLISLRKFDISHNKISVIQPGFFSCSKLNLLNLEYNFIARLGVDILPLTNLNYIKHLYIRGNEFDCSCNVWDTFYAWSTSSKIQIPGYLPKCTADLNQFYGGCVSCQSPYEQKGSSLFSYAANSRCDIVSFLLYMVISASLHFVFVMLGLIGYSKWFQRLVFRKVNQHFRVHHVQRSVQLPNVNKQQIKDKNMFVIYDVDDEEIGNWVDDRLNLAMKFGNPSIPLIIFGKDFHCGYAQSSQLLQRITTCQKCVLILTKNFCSTPKCRFVISALQEIRYSIGYDHMVLVAWSGEDGAPQVSREIQETLNRKKQCFLRFDSTTDDEEMFFETLRTVLVGAWHQD